MKTQISQVDTYTDSPFRGNPGAVCVMEEHPSKAWMSADAAEMDLSETAFLLPEWDGCRLCRYNPTEVERTAGPVYRRMAEMFARGVTLPAPSRDAKKTNLPRCFSPHDGSDGDPNSASAHCRLGPDRGGVQKKTELSAHQASEPGGALCVILNGDRIILRGRAVTVLRGEILSQ